MVEVTELGQTLFETRVLTSEKAMIIGNNPDKKTFFPTTRGH